MTSIEPPKRTTAVTPPKAKPSVLDLMASQYNVDRAKLLETLKETAFKGATEPQLIALCVVAGQYNLNPFLKEIYAFPAKGGGIVPVVGVDGWIKMTNAAPGFDGITFAFAGEGDDLECTATIHIKGRSHPVQVTEYLSECHRNTDPWNTCPRRMLRHKALIQCARVAFGFSGIHDPDEAGEIVDIQAEVTPVPEKRPAALPAKVDPDIEPATPQQALAGLILSNGFDFETFREWGRQSGNLKDADSLGSFDDLSPDDAKRWQIAGKGLLLQLKNITAARA